MTKDKKHRMAILALDDFVPFDLSIAYQLFSLASMIAGRDIYEVFFTGPTDTAVSGEFRICGLLPLKSMLEADTVMVPGVLTAFGYSNEAVLEALRGALAANVRIASICTGACVLAASGILDGLSVTTHWEMTEKLGAAYPDIKMEPDILFTDNDRVLTSAGLSSGIDLCLHIIRKDFGAAVADAVADFFVTPLEREGHQAQFVRSRVIKDGGNLAPLLLWLQENLHLALSLRDMAAYACMSQRTLNRKFQEQLGDSPMTWLARARVRRSQALLETSSMSVEQIAAAVGFASPTAYRQNFRRFVGASPTAWRKTYGSGAAAGGALPLQTTPQGD